MSGALVVMRVIVVHCESERAALTGLFGCGGDVRVQSIDIGENDRISALMELAESCEKSGSARVPQDFGRDGIWAAEAMQKKLRDCIAAEYYDQDVAALMRPAVMFRLCAQDCNNPEAERQRIEKEERQIAKLNERNRVRAAKLHVG
ncbi:hypothetical protein LTR56_019181 [Elasticomyces elasticus]|nr:hypothetical protein LTR22_023698 [Elasticomyces elasticus]KAK3627495.1 hypothetical protein LTR56_019181 [Elasticomyces elasticus]KAK5746723.1 hypothetical protein LTS12_022661 [Elasticomyces elasticus]